MNAALVSQLKESVVMTKHRSILSIVLALVAMLLISCGSPTSAKVPTYTPEQVAEIQSYAKDVSVMGDRLPELQALIEKEDWTFVRNFIHGPLGELRVKMSAVTRDLLPNAQKPSRQAAKEFFDALVTIDRAAGESNSELATRKYSEAVKAFDAFFRLIPQA